MSEMRVHSADVESMIHVLLGQLLVDQMVTDHCLWECTCAFSRRSSRPGPGDAHSPIIDTSFAENILLNIPVFLRCLSHTDQLFSNFNVSSA